MFNAQLQIPRFRNSKWGRKDTVPIGLERVGSKGPATCLGQLIKATEISPRETAKRGRSPSPFADLPASGP